MAAHRYWRLNIRSTGSADSHCSIAELYGYAAGFIDSQLAGVAVTASNGAGAPYQEANIVDNNLSTFWYTAAFVNPTTITFDLGAGVAKDIRQIGFYGRQDQLWTQCPKDYDWQSSDDNVTWTTVFSGTVPVPTGPNQLYLSPSAGPATMERVGEANVLTAIISPAGTERTVTAGALVALNYPAAFEKVSQVAGLVTVKNALALRTSEAAVLVAVRGRTQNPKLRAWTFTLDGHDFYVLRLGTMGTLVYDLYSGQWMDWDAFSQIYWPVNCGFNWVDGQGVTDSSGNTFGSNVVVGDDTYPLLWILEPLQPYDQSPDGPLDPQTQYNFTRILQGQFPVVGREVVPCYAAWLTTDMGNPGYVGAGVKLEISDDAGASYQDMGTITVTAGHNYPELAWYSLGQIAAPGRLFRITDDGAVARIDTLEMNDPDDAPAKR